MRILVDADACPVKEIILKLAKKYQLETHMFFDNSHQYEDGYSTVYILDKGADSVDYFLINKVNSGDIVVTQDYGVASMALAKNAYPIHHNGIIFTNDNMIPFLESRRLHQKLRRHKNLKGPKKRTKKNDQEFEKQLDILISSNL